MRLRVTRVLIVVVAAFLMSGCGLKYAVKEPVVSGFKYEKSAVKPAVLKIVDQRSNRVYQEKLGGLSRASIELQNMDDPIAWLSRALDQEFQARSMPVKIADDKAQGPADIVLTVKRFQIANRRVSGFSPWESYHSFRGTVTVGSTTTDLRAFFFNGKVPVWSMGEIEEPCINMPLSLLVKEIASKINRATVRSIASDANVKAMATRAGELAKKKDDNACFPLFELGGSNNAGAIRELTPFTENEDRFIRACALSALGSLGAGNQLEILKKKYATHDEIDKYMALKSIGDIGTPQAADFVSKAKSDPLYNREFAFKYCVDLYLEK
jgi:hypothetical protein